MLTTLCSVVVLLLCAGICSPVSAQQQQPDSCSSVSFATNNITWSGDCTSLNVGLSSAGCWRPARIPTSNDTAIVFPSGTTAALYGDPATAKPAPFRLFNATNVLVAAGAKLLLHGNGIEINGCLIVDGTVALAAVDPKNQSAARPGGTGYGRQPTQHNETAPENSCHHMPIGFTPRICGPGRFLVRPGGLLHLNGLFASLFLGGTIDASGALVLRNHSFFWGEVTNHGEITTHGYTYVHGFLTNLGEATFATVAFDKWATTFAKGGANSLYIENNGTLVLTQDLYTTIANYSDGTKGTYRAVVTNNNQMRFVTTSSATTGIAQYATTEFDLFNYGTVTWTCVGRYLFGQFAGRGNFVNHGLMVANATDVYLNAFHSHGGTMHHSHGGQFTFGAGPQSKEAVQLCELLPPLPAAERQRFEKRQSAANARIHVHAPAEALTGVLNVVNGKHCWMYGNKCLNSPYYSGEIIALLAKENGTEIGAGEENAADGGGPKLVESAGVSAAEAHSPAVRGRIYQMLSDRRRRLKLGGNNIQQGVATSSDDDRRTALHYTCNSRYTFLDTTITGDGTGSVLSTLPIEIPQFADTTTEKKEHMSTAGVTIAAGGRWFAMTEHHLPPVYGGGRLEVASGGSFHAGIVATFSEPGEVVVRAGGRLVVPRHATVRFDNHSVATEAGSLLHVDGIVAFGRMLSGDEERSSNFPRTIRHCGNLEGRGEIRKRADDDMKC